ncbi:MAG: hypothetical protein HY352_06030 [Candidatus Omnitrophica bacterium]|nr:hypothetical protein [Candidatus Omnitrophota bacterium]
MGRYLQLDSSYLRQIARLTGALAVSHRATASLGGAPGSPQDINTYGGTLAAASRRRPARAIDLPGRAMVRFLVI